MKSKWVLLFCIIVGFCLVFAACEGKNKKSSDAAEIVEIIDVFKGTWISTDGAEGQPAMQLVAENNSFREYLIANDLEVIRGTYTVSGDVVSATLAEVNTILFGAADEWYNYDELSDIFKGYVGSEIQEITIDNDTFIQGGVIFTKQ